MRGVLHTPIILLPPKGRSVILNYLLAGQQASIARILRLDGDLDDSGTALYEDIHALQTENVLWRWSNHQQVAFNHALFLRIRGVSVIGIVSYIGAP